MEGILFQLTCMKWDAACAGVMKMLCYIGYKIVKQF